MMRRKKKRPVRSQRKSSALEQIFTVRVPTSFESELDGFLSTMQAQVPWVRLTRADALRWLLEEGIKRIDDQLANGGQLKPLPEK